LQFQEQSHFVLACSSLPALTEGCALSTAKEQRVLEGGVVLQGWG